MNIQAHRFGRAAMIFTAGAWLAACSSKPHERPGAERGGTGNYGSRGAGGLDSANPKGTEPGGHPGIGGMGVTGTLLLDTVYQRNRSGNPSDSARPVTDRGLGTGVSGTRGRGSSGMDTLRGPDSRNRDSSQGFPDAYPGTGAPGSRPEGGSGKGGTRDTLDLDKINDSLGVLDWYERG